MSITRHTQSLFEDVLNEIEDLPAPDRAEVELLIEHNEPIVAFETLTTQTYEWALPVGETTYAKLEELAGRLGLDHALLQPIRDELVV